MNALLTTEQAAEVLGVPAQALKADRTTELGQLNVPYVRLSKKRIRYRPEDLTSWIARRTQVPIKRQSERYA